MKTTAYPSGLAVLLVCLYVSSAQGQPPPAELELLKINDELYVIHNVGAPGNATALITNEGVLLIDDKFDRDYDNMMRLLRSVTDQPVRYLVNTHHHADHTGSNARFYAAGTVIVATEQARVNMVETNVGGLPSFTMEESARIHIGGKVVDLFYLGRAHTNGDLVVYFPQFRTLVAGDLFNFGPGTPQLIDYAGGGSAKAWTQTLDNIMALGFETVVPGHGVVTTKAEMQKFRDSTVALRNRVQALVRGGSSRDEVEAVMRAEFGWQDLHVTRGLDGLFGELR